MELSYVFSKKKKVFSCISKNRTFLIFFLKKVFLIFWEIELFKPSLNFFPEKSLLYFFQKKYSEKVSYIFEKRFS